MKGIKTTIKEKFDYDTDDLAPYIEEQSTEILTDLIYSSSLMERIQVMENVKGSEKIKLLDADFELQSAEDCDLDEQGTIHFSDKTITTTRVGFKLSLCNEDLVGKWSQLLLAVGASRQDEELPFEAVLTAYIIKKTAYKNQNLMFRGDTTSLTPDLAHYDGFVKLWNADAAVANVNVAEAGFTNTNGFTIAQAMANAIPGDVVDNGIVAEVIGNRSDLQAVINSIWNAKDYSANVQKSDDGTISFELPTTTTTFRSYPQLQPGEMFAVIYQFMFFGTDLLDDMSGIKIWFDENTDKLYIKCRFRSGVQYVFGDKFRKLNLTGS